MKCNSNSLREMEEKDGKEKNMDVKKIRKKNDKNRIEK